MLFLIPLILCIGKGTQSVDINRVHKDTWGDDFGGNFTKLCGIPFIIHMDNPLNSDAKLLFAMNNGDVRNAL